MNPDAMGLCELDCLVNDIPEDWDRGDYDPEAGKAEHRDLMSFLSNELGYAHHLVEMENGKCASAVFYKKDKFRCLKKDHLQLDNLGPATRSLVYCHLMEIDSELEFIFSETHFKGLPGKENEDIRCEQVQNIKNFFNEEYKDIPVFVCGDLNDQPQSTPVQKMDKKFIDLHSLRQMDPEGKYKHMDFTVVRQDQPQIDLQTLLVKGIRSPVKKQQHNVVLECLDYMFVAKNEAYDDNKPLIEAFLEQPKRNPLLYSEEADKLLIPSEQWPSDHFSLVYTVKLACPLGTRLIDIKGQKHTIKPKLSIEF